MVRRTAHLVRYQGKTTYSDGSRLHYVVVMLVPEGCKPIQLPATKWPLPAEYDIQQFGFGAIGANRDEEGYRDDVRRAKTYIANFDPDQDLAERVAKRLTGARR